ncbi:DUF1800 domain-containing protein [Nitrospira moscoviensis]|uniref:DUF1800 domain-containing protein n=1 Tax=Nitrospira moscoviensis TaxID=42253 RepID=A0A0K2GCV1_NITMO|nr:DUF1800 domain-containing protein [Nitrospira moscoviensis]ALA58791.1 exported protein of unknown function [Nitrospira moscoviensis]
MHVPLIESHRTSKPAAQWGAWCLVAGSLLAPLLSSAHQAPDTGAGVKTRHSLLRPIDGIAGTSGVVEQKPEGGKVATKTVPRKKSTQRGGKSDGRRMAPFPEPMSDQRPVENPSHAVASMPALDAAGAPAPAVSSAAFAAPLLSGAPPAVPAGSLAAPAGPATAGGSIMGSAPAPLPMPRNLQRLLKEIPGIARIITTPAAGPVEVAAPPAPPLAQPAAGLPAPPANWFAYHVLSRATFGGTPNQLNAISHMNAAQAIDWADRHLKEQLGLDPARPWPTTLHSTAPLPPAIPILDGTADQLLAQDKANWRPHEDDPSLLVPTLTQLQDYDLIRKMHSRRQLFEKMVYFWDNHFNTDYRSHFAGQYELYENEALRARAYDRFIDLLLASAKSPAMMVYLNTDVNVKESPNENYAREVLELHTLGVDEQGKPAGYTQADIVEAAKTFTGWDTPQGPAPGFRFVPSRHSPGAKSVLGQTIPFDGTGPGEGERVLQIAAAHPATGKHLAKKLCEYFVSETPSPSLLAEVASVFSDSGGDIRKVLIAIFTSADFRDVRNYRALTKTPLEFVVGLYRNLGVWSARDPFRSRLTRIGQGLFEMPPPTGYKEKSDHWLNTHVLFHEVALAYEATIPGFGSTVRYGSDTTGGLTRMWLKQMGLKTEEDVLASS